MASNNFSKIDSSSNNHHHNNRKPEPKLVSDAVQTSLAEHAEVREAHVVIVGAGMSGLSAGLKLARLDYEVVIVEARDRVGGRIETRAFKNDESEHEKGVIDLGASFLHGVEGNPLVELMKEFKQPVHFEDEEEPIKIYSSDGPALPDDVSKKLKAHAYHTFFESARTDSQAADSPDLAASLGSYLYDSKSPLFEAASGPEERVVLAHLVGGLESWTGAALEQVALRWWGFEREFGGKDGVVSCGYGTLVNLMAQEFVRLGGKLMLGHECLGLEHDAEAGLVRTYVQPTAPDHLPRDEDDGRIPRPAEQAGFPHSLAPPITLQSSYSICTLPLGVLKAIVAGDKVPRNFFNPPLPARRQQAIKRTGFGLLNKVILRYERPWWPVNAPWLVLLPLAHSGSLRSSSSSASLSSSKSSASSDSSSPSSVWPCIRASNTGTSMLESTIFATSVKVQNYVPITGEPALVFFFGASAGEAIEELTDDAVAEMMHAKLAAHLDVNEEDEPEGPSECIVTRWRADRFSRGSYAYIPPYLKEAWSDEPATPLDIMEMSRPLWNGRLGWAGEHCQVDHYACVHGPHMSGCEEAERIHVAFQASASASAV
ncbi:hypothetical protein CROQUDRAFT_649867 [Cronartium quercuum f. sp. fusiforme G11]|uniref:Amine oxidase domain-containing protein n=1 Tax=Cronartium quercuum f. sp. fusiforme G11 TaxID=708437 RepID=A0A9P6NVM6_9BASI|nr:hypothetical protein CROQUDRAFT_649867 [Cronartium quercuum f. sp. fusiforme G11]